MMFMPRYLYQVDSINVYNENIDYKELVVTI